MILFAVIRQDLSFCSSDLVLESFHPNRGIFHYKPTFFWRDIDLYLCHIVVVIIMTS